MSLASDINAFVDTYKGMTVYWVELDGKNTTVEAGNVRGFKGSSVDGQIEVTLLTTNGDVSLDRIYESVEDVTTAIDSYFTNLRNDIVATIPT